MKQWYFPDIWHSIKFKANSKAMNGFGVEAWGHVPMQFAGV
jgi:hypothetical protein